MYYTVIEITREMWKTRAAGECFLECSRMSGVFYHSVIYDLGFFVCFMISVEAMWRKIAKHTFSLIYTLIKHGFSKTMHA